MIGFETEEPPIEDDGHRLTKTLKSTVVWYQSNFLTDRYDSALSLSRCLCWHPWLHHSYFPAVSIDTYVYIMLCRDIYTFVYFVDWFIQITFCFFYSWRWIRILFLFLFPLTTVSFGYSLTSRPYLAVTWDTSLSSTYWQKLPILPFVESPNLGSLKKLSHGAGEKQVFHKTKHSSLVVLKNCEIVYLLQKQIRNLDQQRNDVIEKFNFVLFSSF